MTSIASANILFRSSSRMPRASASDVSDPGLMPKMKRPSDRWSSIAAWDAIRTGCIWERFDVPVASLMVLVSDTRDERNSMLFVIVSHLSVRCETGFGFGLNFLATLQAWRGQPGRLHYVAVEKHPFSLQDLRTLHARYPEFEKEAAELHSHWPPLVPGGHRAELGNVVLTLFFADIAVAATCA